jgi:hypothetical protein
MRRLLKLLVPCVLLSGCFGPGEGLEVPEDEIYFPVGLAMDPSGEHLFVVSSDFDLQYNGGTLQSYRLGGDRSVRGDGLFEELPLSCASDQDCSASSQGKGVCDNGLCVAEVGGSPCSGDERSPEQRLLFPGRCVPINQKPLIQSRAKIGAFATDIVLRQRPFGQGDPERLFIPVRGDTTLHWIDVDNGELHCGQANNDGACDDQHRAGDDAAAENARDLELQTEPFAIDANELGTTLVVSNQTSGTASLFVNDWGAGGPKLRFALASERIPSRPVAIASLPLPLQQQPEDPKASASDTFLVAFRNAAQVRLMRFAPDAASDPPREYLVDGGGVNIDANSVGNDSRGLAVDASERKAAEERCADGDAACLGAAALIPVDVYVANRSPASLLIGRTRPPQEYPYFFQTLPLTIGPSRVVVGRVRTPSGEEETRVFVVCFDSRRIFVYDPKRARFETEIFTGRGPHAVAVDTARSLLYVGHFTDSFIGVFSLDLSSPATYGTMLGTLGTPKAPRSSK